MCQIHKTPEICIKSKCIFFATTGIHCFWAHFHNNGSLKSHLRCKMPLCSCSCHKKKPFKNPCNCEITTIVTQGCKCGGY